MPREQFWFFHSLRVRYSEVGAQGVVLNAHCLTYFDTTITEYFHAFGCDQFASAKQSGVDFYVVKSVVKCNEPIFLTTKWRSVRVWPRLAILASCLRSMYF